MKSRILCAFFFVSTSTFAESNLKAQLKEPLELSINKISAVMQVIKKDSGIKDWAIHGFSVNEDLVKVEFLNKRNGCSAKLYSLSSEDEMNFQATLVKDVFVLCQ